MKAGADMKTAGKTVCVFVLLTITKVTRTADESNGDQSAVRMEEREVCTGHNRVSATVGNSSVLICSPKPNTTMVTWKISPKVGGRCSLGYRADQNKTDRTNCSDSINWKFRPDWDPTLEIRPVGRAHEGSYTCEVVVADGNFHTPYYLTVLVPPRLTLSCDDQGNPVCEAMAGKPAAQISWVLENNSTPKEEEHDNGTVTVLSKFTGYSTNETTCTVSHPTGNWSKSIACRPSKSNDFIQYVYIILCFLSIITFMAVFYYFKLHRDRLCHKTKPPETAPTHSPQDDTMEVEPYTTYVQKENVIYNSVSDLTVGQNLLQGLSPAT